MHHSTKGSAGIRLAVTAGGMVLLLLIWLSRRSRQQHEQALLQISPSSALEGLLSLPVYRWVYRFQPTIPHMGFMAQDFYERFGLGDPHHIYVVDAIAVLSAALQALYEQYTALEQQVQRLSGSGDTGQEMSYE